MIAQYCLTEYTPTDYILRKGGTAKMGHLIPLAKRHLPMIFSNQESTLTCAHCGSNTITVLTTPYGKLCSGCYRTVYNVPEPPPTIHIHSSSPTSTHKAA